jgi:hypothetical protein
MVLIVTISPATGPNLTDGSVSDETQEVPTVEVITEHFRRDVGSDQDLTLGAFEGEAPSSVT